jgi:HEPN domain-containing protein
MTIKFDWKKVGEYWLEEAEEALEVADNLYEKGHYSYSLFFGHLAIEKYLKSLYVMVKNEQAPLIHHLDRLADAVNVAMSPEQRESLIRISTFNIEARYPDLKRSFRTKCTPEFTREELRKIKDIAKWLKSIQKS